MYHRKRGAGLFASSVGIAAVVTAGFEPLEVLVGWIGAGILRLVFMGAAGFGKEKGTAWITIAAGIPITAGLVWAAEQAFPQESTFPFVSGCILLLLYRIMIGEKENAVITGNVLGLCILPLIAVIELFGVKNLDWTQMMPYGFSGMHVLIVMGIATPWWAMESGEKPWSWFLASGGASVVMSTLTAGILGKALRAKTDAPLYRAVQGIEIFGKLQRFEALLAAAILMGIFSAAILMGEKMREAIEVLGVENKKKYYLWIMAAVFATELIIRSVKQTNGYWITGIYWGLILLYGIWVVFFNKVEKGENNA
ncbi:MAG: hypothetical protein PUC06_08955 [Oscillospiraceae bacterium]|nr:hypothetical protein [Oscillospiraceae bacterium]